MFRKKRTKKRKTNGVRGAKTPAQTGELAKHSGEMIKPTDSKWKKYRKKQHKTANLFAYRRIDKTCRTSALTQRLPEIKLFRLTSFNKFWGNFWRNFYVFSRFFGILFLIIFLHVILALKNHLFIFFLKSQWKKSPFTQNNLFCAYFWEINRKVNFLKILQTPNIFSG